MSTALLIVELVFLIPGLGLAFYLGFTRVDEPTALALANRLRWLVILYVLMTVTCVAALALRVVNDDRPVRTIISTGALIYFAHRTWLSYGQYGEALKELVREQRAVLHRAWARQQKERR